MPIELRGSPQELACYGCDMGEFAESVDNSLTVKCSPPHIGYPMVVMSMMSDAQEELERGLKEQARQTLNRAKWVISNRLMTQKV